jgi:hypothetical protein
MTGFATNERWQQGLDDDDRESVGRLIEAVSTIATAGPQNIESVRGMGRSMQGLRGVEARLTRAADSASRGARGFADSLELVVASAERFVSRMESNLAAVGLDEASGSVASS